MHGLPAPVASGVSSHRTPLLPRPTIMSDSAPAIMTTVPLGHTGVKVSPLCLGMMTYGSRKWREWILEEEAARPIVRRAVEAGINFFDTADVYSLGESEVLTGKLLREFQPRRESLVLATKVFNPMSDEPNDRGLSRNPGLHRRFPQASRRRLRRPLPDPPLRQKHSHRGDLRGPPRCRQGR
jgi:hypothetical protein